MARNADDVSSQSPTPSGGNPEGADLRSVANQIEGLLDDDGHFNPDGGMSRGHPDYDESEDPRAQTPERDERGRFKAAESDAQPDDTGEPVDDDESLDIPAAGDDQDEDTPQGDTDEDLAASADDDATPGEQETDAIQSLAEFATALDMSLDDLKDAVTHSFNAAGEEVTVTLTELEKGYQKDADYRRSTAKLAQDRQAAEAGFVQRHQAYEAENHLLANTLQVAEQIVGAELNAPALAELRERDPAEWTARREEIGQRLGVLRNARAQAAQQYENFVTGAKQQLRERELAMLTEKLPEFGKEHRDTAKALMADMGFVPQEISEIMDHRLILGVLELASLRNEVAELRKLKEQGEQTAKRVKKEVPKLQKPGKRRQSTKTVSRDNLTKLRKRAAQTGKIDDAAKVIEQLL